MKKIFWLLFVLSACSPPIDANTRFIDNNLNVAAFQRSVVVIVRKDENNRLQGPSCTAFYISPRRLATALHCVEVISYRTIQVIPGLTLQVPDRSETIGSETLLVDFDEQNRFIENFDPNLDPQTIKTTVVSIDEDNDLAILELIDEEEDSEHWLPLANSYRVGEQVYTMGMPRNQFWLLSHGIISSVRIFPNGTERILHQNIVAPGSSGSPVINDLGEVVGVTIQYVEDVPGLAVATSVNDLKNLASVEYRPTDILSVLDNGNNNLEQTCEQNGNSCQLP